MRAKFKGLMAATHTPFTAEGELRLAAVEQQAEFLRARGVVGVFICGTTGECLSLTVEERIVLAEQWAAAARRHGLMLFVQVGHNALPDARRLAAHAQRIGADAIAALPPSYYKPANLSQVLNYCRQVSEAAADLPFYYYDIPQMTGVQVSASQLLELGKSQIPQLAGLKFSHADLPELQQCLQRDNGAFDVLFGRDEALLAGLALGVEGVIGGTYNFAAPLYTKIMRQWAAGELDAARRLQLLSVKMVATLLKYNGFLPASKTVMRFLGVDCGEVRTPLAPLTAEQTAALRTELEHLGFFDWAQS